MLSPKRTKYRKAHNASLPVMKEVKQEAKLRQLELLVLPTGEAIKVLERDPEANAILHLTC